MLAFSFASILVGGSLVAVGLGHSKPFHLRLGPVMPIFIYNPDAPSSPFQAIGGDER